jgi:hypothetical protein
MEMYCQSPKCARVGELETGAKTIPSNKFATFRDRETFGFRWHERRGYWRAWAEMQHDLICLPGRLVGFLHDKEVAEKED